MNRAFCECGREHEWPEHWVDALCPCGRIVNPMTTKERQTARENHEARLGLISLRCYDVFRLQGTK